MAVTRFAIVYMWSKQKMIISVLFVLFFYLAIADPFKTSSLNTSNENLVLLGRNLFYDTRLSYNQTKSCASCHDPSLAFSDGYRTSVGADGYALKRNAPSLLNARYRSSLTWSDIRVTDFSKQLFFPFFNQHPKELGWDNTNAMVAAVKSIPLYTDQFKKLFPGKQPIQAANIFSAIVAFEETLVSYGSKYDAYLQGDTTVLQPNEKQGMKLFFSEKLKCGNCHVWDEKNNTSITKFENIGLYNINSTNNYPSVDQGLFDHTKIEANKGKFRVPSLRNVLLTAPYTHDGTVVDIQEMISVYENGGRLIESGLLAGDGRKNRYKSKLIKGFKISKTEKQNLIAFLNCFTDTSYLQNKKLLFVALN